MKYVVVIIAILLVGSAMAQEVELVLRLEKGKEYKLTCNSRATLSQEVNGEKIEVTVRSMHRMTYLVRSINSNGYDMDVTFEELGYSMQAADREVNFSSTETDSDDPFSRMLKAMTGRPFDLTLSPNGKVVQMGDNDRVWQKVIDEFKEIPEAKRKAAKERLIGSFGEGAFKELFESGMGIFPDKKIQVGDKWTSTRKESSMNLLVMSTYQLAAVSTDHLVIKATAIVSPDGITYQKEKGGASSYDMQGSVISKFTFDRTTGWIIEGKINQVTRGHVYKTGEEGFPLVVVKEDVFTNR